jgi:hypothetical protein
MPTFVQRLRIVEFTLDHEAPYVSNMRRRNSRKDSDLNGVVDVRYTGGARMLLALEVGGSRRLGFSTIRVLRPAGQPRQHARIQPGGGSRSAAQLPWSAAVGPSGAREGSVLFAWCFPQHRTYK